MEGHDVTATELLRSLFRGDARHGFCKWIHPATPVYAGAGLTDHDRPVGPGNVALGNMDGDGKPDLVVASLTVFLGHGLQSSRVFELPVARPLLLSQCPRQCFALGFLRIIEEYLCGFDPADF